MYFDVVAVVDPVTRDAQKLAPFLLVGSRSIVVCGYPHLSVICMDDMLLFSLSTACLLFWVFFWILSFLLTPNVSPLAGSQEAGERQLAYLHELPVETVGNAAEEVRAEINQTSSLLLPGTV